ncbi:hypothetical protein BJF78_20315 [Pseudonocardia sp. CNS-139]|nr:hypothetical protein BJF78_20315 [Pseudonocardia sp. CNS-139]
MTVSPSAVIVICRRATRPAASTNSSSGCGGMPASASGVPGGAAVRSTSIARWRTGVPRTSAGASSRSSVIGSVSSSNWLAGVSSPGLPAGTASQPSTP